MKPGAILIGAALVSSADPDMRPGAIFIVGALAASVVWMFAVVWLLDRQRALWRQLARRDDADRRRP